MIRVENLKNKGTYPLTRYVKASLEGSAPPTAGPSTQATPSTQGPTGAATTNSPGGEFTCPQTSGFFPHPQHCNLFYQCANNVAHLLSCPPPLHFNPSSNNCDWDFNANCKPTQKSLH